MANPYTQPSLTGYNANPPSDDGSETGSNRVDWATIKEKLADTLKTYTQAIDSAVLAAFGKRLLNTVNAQSTSYEVTSNDEGAAIHTTNTITVTCPAASSSTIGFAFLVVNTDGGTVTIAKQGSDTIAGTTSLSAAGDAALVYGVTSSSWRSIGLQAGAFLENIVEDTTPQLGGNLDCQLNKITNVEASINAQTGTTYSTVDGDSGKIITLSNASAITLTVAADANPGFICTIVQLGAGQVTVAAGGSGNIRNFYGHTKLAGQYAMATIFVPSNAGSAPQAYLNGVTA